MYADAKGQDDCKQRSSASLHHLVQASCDLGWRLLIKVEPWEQGRNCRKAEVPPPQSAPPSKQGFKAGLWRTEFRGFPCLSFCVFRTFPAFWARHPNRFCIWGKATFRPQLRPQFRLTTPCLGGLQDASVPHQRSTILELSLAMIRRPPPNSFPWLGIVAATERNSALTDDRIRIVVDLALTMTVRPFLATLRTARITMAAARASRPVEVKEAARVKTRQNKRKGNSAAALRDFDHRFPRLGNYSTCCISPISKQMVSDLADVASTAPKWRPACHAAGHEMCVCESASHRSETLHPDLNLACVRCMQQLLPGGETAHTCPLHIYMDISIDIYICVHTCAHTQDWVKLSSGDWSSSVELLP